MKQFQEINKSTGEYLVDTMTKGLQLMWIELEKTEAPEDIRAQAAIAYWQTLKLRDLFKYYKKLKNDNKRSNATNALEH